MSSSTSSHSEVLPNDGQREFDMTTIVVIATVGGGGVLLIIIAFIVVVIRLTRRSVSSAIRCITYQIILTSE